MKRTYFLFVVTLFSMQFLFAGTAIQNSFFGCTLGESTIKEVQFAMTSQGFKLSQKTIDTLSINTYICSYSGVFENEGGIFNTMITAFVDDTLRMVVLNGEDNNHTLSDKVQANLESKYGNNESADDDLMSFQPHTRTALSSDTKMWARYEGSTIVSSLSCAGYFDCWYVDMNVRYGVFALAIGDLVHKYPREFFVDYCEKNKVYGVAGVKFGDSREFVNKTIRSRSDCLTGADAHSLSYYKTQMGGNIYNHSSFYFGQDGGLVTAAFTKIFALWEKETATMAYENIISQYKRKYSNFKVVRDDEEDKLCSCGSYIAGYDFPPILISLTKSLSENGKTMVYYVHISYYGSRLSNLYDDEI